MISGHVFIAVSVDGYIARLDGALDWLEAEGSAGEDHGFDEFVQSMDAIVMGRNTFETVLSFDSWPYSKPVIALSHTLAEQALPARLAGRASVLPSVDHVLMECKKRGWGRLYIDGGITIQSFLKRGLIRDLVITRIPVLLGSGVPLFGPLTADIKLRHVTTRSFGSGLVQSRYEIAL